jgi:mono/diheme cytochrome c family protein
MLPPMTIGRMGVLALSLVSMLAACDAGSDSEPSVLPEGDVARGAFLVETGMCKSCHADDLAGSPDPLPGSTIYSSNITPDLETGIGMWTDKELDDVMRLGKDDKGEAVCDPMPVYDQMTAQDSADVIAYMRSVPPVRRLVPQSECR